MIAATVGLGLTAGTVLYFRKQANLTPNQYALILSIGFFITWLASFFAPFLAPSSQIPNNGVIIFGVVLAISTGMLTYMIVYIVMIIIRRNK